MQIRWRVPVKYFVAGTELEHVNEIRDSTATLNVKLTWVSVPDTVINAVTSRALDLLIRYFQTCTGTAKFNRSTFRCVFRERATDFRSVASAETAKSHMARINQA